jgi:ribosomal protein S18 acetylase RimI-like enzyme
MDLRNYKLAEEHLSAVVAIEDACTAMYHAAGFSPDRVKPRDARAIVALTKQHNVWVVEQDHEAVAYVAWRDESPGVAYIEELSVHPKHQRKGIGKRLIEIVRGDASKLGLKVMALRTYASALWAAELYRRAGFVPIDDDAPETIRRWKEEQSANGPLTEEGQVALWAKV